MYLTSRDMARFGYLYLNNGMVEGRQILNADWIEESLQISSEITSWPGFGYGYAWWLGRMKEYETYSARGLGGQLIYIFPDLNMIVVTTASGSNKVDTSNQIPFIEETIIENYILSSVLN